MADLHGSGQGIDLSRLQNRLADSGSRTDAEATEFLPNMMDHSAPSESDLMVAARELVRLRTASATPSADPSGSPAGIASILAAGSLPLRLRWLTGAAPGWMIWDGRRWATCADAVPLPLNVEIRRAVASGIEARRIDAKAIMQLESAAGMRGIGTLLSAHPSMQLDAARVDPPGLIAFRSHAFNLTTGERLIHDPTRPITKACPVDPGQPSELWPVIADHLRACLGQTAAAVQRYLGSCLLGRGADRRLLWLHGPGGDGKSTLVRVLRHALGEYLAVVPSEVFSEGGRGAHGHELASGMAGARLAVALEVGSRLDWPKLKGLSGGDEQVSKRMYGRAFAFQRPPLLVLVANEAPRPPDNASAERLIVAKLFPPDDPDERLVQVLADGGPARDQLASSCLGWLCDGCRDYLAEGLGPVPSVAAMPTGLDQWWQQATAAGELVARRGWTTPSLVWDHYATWSQHEGQPVASARELGSFLRTVVQAKRTNSGVRYALTIAGVTDGEG